MLKSFTVKLFSTKEGRLKGMVIFSLGASTQRIACLFFIQLIFGGMFAYNENAPAKGFSFLQAIDPGHGIGSMITFVEQAQHLVEVFGLDLFLFDVSSFYFFQLEAHFSDDAGKAHTTTGGPVQFCVLGRRKQVSVPVPVSTSISMM